ncbi:hypothetical protein BG004_007366 [Podila humilis]|nr:hypothetical protein BG004_007366 [Podila humilis]
MAIIEFTADQQRYFLASGAIHLAYFHLIKWSVPYVGNDRKRRSWILTTVTAMVISIISAYLLFQTCRTSFHAPLPYSQYEYIERFDVSFPAPGTALSLNDSSSSESLLQAKISFYQAYDQEQASTSNVFSLFHTIIDARFVPGDSQVGQATLIFFIMYLVTDLVLAMAYYLEQVTIITGWFHHSLYMFMSFHSLNVGMAHIFSSYFIIEVPTFFMGLGQMYKPLRHDMLFGVLFILFRIVFDFAYTHEFVVHRPEMSYTTKSFILLKSVMHTKFLVDWIHQQKRLRAKLAKETKILKNTPCVTVTATATVSATAYEGSSSKTIFSLNADQISQVHKMQFDLAKDLNGMVAIVDQKIESNQGVSSMSKSTSTSLNNARRRNLSGMKDTLELQSMQDLLVAH